MINLLNPHRFVTAAGGGGIPVVESYNTATVINNTDITVSKPSGSSTNDLFVIAVASGTQNGSGPPSGWTDIDGGTSRGCALDMFYKVVTGSEGSSETITSTLGDDKVAWYIHISGNDATTPIDVEGSMGNSTPGTTHSVTGATTTQDDCLALYFLGLDQDGTFSVSGTGWSQTDQLLESTNGVSACWGEQDMATAGATGTATVTSSIADGSNWKQFAIAPV